ncbi:MAG: cytidylate kinase-like family protein [Desulfobacteraceae bacterium]|nr:cytidylate kinase-like family protein [Desulfobacteraceae bacterium]
MTVLTISREFGAGGRTLGKMVANKMGYTLVDENIVQMVAERARVSDNWVRSIEKEAGGSLLKFINYCVSQKYVNRILDGSKGDINENIYINLLQEIITELAEEGNCVIVGRGGQYILRDYPAAFHVLMVAEYEDRVRFMMENYKFNREKAQNTIRVHGRRRRTLYRKFGKEDYNHPGLYHLVLNMSKLSMEKATDIACGLLSS